MQVSSAGGDGIAETYQKGVFFTFESNRHFWPKRLETSVFAALQGLCHIESMSPKRASPLYVRSATIAAIVCSSIIQAVSMRSSTVCRMAMGKTFVVLGGPSRYGPLCSNRCRHQWTSGLQFAVRLQHTKATNPSHQSLCLCLCLRSLSLCLNRWSLVSNLRHPRHLSRPPGVDTASDRSRHWMRLCSQRSLHTIWPIVNSCRSPLRCCIRNSTFLHGGMTIRTAAGMHSLRVDIAGRATVHTIIFRTIARFYSGLRIRRYIGGWPLAAWRFDPWRFDPCNGARHAEGQKGEGRVAAVNVG